MDLIVKQAISPDHGKIIKRMTKEVRNHLKSFTKATDYRVTEDSWAISESVDLKISDKVSVRVSIRHDK